MGVEVGVPVVVPAATAIAARTSAVGTAAIHGDVGAEELELELPSAAVGAGPVPGAVGSVRAGVGRGRLGSDAVGRGATVMAGRVTARLGVGRGSAGSAR